ncbi:MAG: DNA-directed DNA polymerase [Candidatus Odinarchaeia archaeon]
MIIDFWLLDVGYVVEEGLGKILLWGKRENGETALLIVDNFYPYFYLVPENENSIERIVNDLKQLPILNVEIVERKYFNQKLKVIKVLHKDPTESKKLERLCLKINGVKDCLENDIRYYVKYLADSGLKPCTWCKFEVEEVEKRPVTQADHVYRVISGPQYYEKEDIPKLKIMAYDIEVYSPSGAHNPEKDPVVIISTATNDGNRRQFTAEDSDDTKLLEEFTKYTREYDPDIIAGYYSNFFDFPYLIKRYEVKKVKFKIGREGSTPHPSVYGHVSVGGRAHIDIYDIAEQFVPEVKVKTLKNLAEFYKVMLKKDRVIIDHGEISQHWADEKLRSKLLEYAMQDAEATLGLMNKLLPFTISMAQVIGMPMDQVMRASYGFKVENLLIREAHLTGELVPKRKDKKSFASYIGGLVLPPAPGIHENIAVYDFASLYPNLMIKYNISPDTYIPPEIEVPEDEVYISPENKHRFLKKPDGFYRKILERLLKARETVKAMMKKYPKGSLKYTMLNEQQKAIKIAANTIYGYCGWLGARWYLKPVAESVAEWGRKTIKRTIEIAKLNGLKVIYADTDSVFITYIPDKVEAFDRMVEEEMGLEIKPDKIYKRVFFTEAKKRYAGILEDGTLDIVGFETIRGDWSELAKEVQENVIKIVLEKRDVKEAVKYVREVIDQLCQRKIPYEKLIIWETLTKKVDEYKIVAPHVIAAKKLLEAGGRLTAGAKIGYVIVSGEGKISDKATPYTFATVEDIDVEYYVKNQIVPAAARVLSNFGVTKRQLTPTKPCEGVVQTSLDLFSKK